MSQQPAAARSSTIVLALCSLKQLPRPQQFLVCTITDTDKDAQGIDLALGTVRPNSVRTQSPKRQC